MSHYDVDRISQMRAAGWIWNGHVGYFGGGTMNVNDALAMGVCPLCGVPFADPDDEGRCDHEAGHYRDWLALFADGGVEVPPMLGPMLTEAEYKGER